MSTPDTDMRKTIDPIMRHFPIWIALAALGMACWGPVERVYASYINKPGGGSGSNYQTIEDEGVALTQRPTFNFIGGTIAATDDAGNNRTNVTVSGAGSGNVTTSATLTAGLPVIGNGTVDVDIGTRSGNTTEYMNGDGGGYGSGNCAEFDANGNITDSGAGCGGGSSVIDAATMVRAASQSITISTDTKILFDTVVLAGSSSITADATTNNRFDIDDDGVYLVTMSLMGQDIDASGLIYCRIYVDGSEVSRSVAASSAANLEVSASATALLALTAGQYVEMYTRFTASGSPMPTFTQDYLRPTASVIRIL